MKKINALADDRATLIIHQSKVIIVFTDEQSP